MHISAVERAGLSNLNEGQKVSYEIVTDRGKESAAISRFDVRLARRHHRGLLIV